MNNNITEFKMPVQTLDKIMQVLIALPYAQVAEVIAEIHKTVVPVEQPKVEE